MEGSTVTTETTVVDDEGRVTQESGSEKGHESTTTTAQTSEVTVKDREPVTKTKTGETVTTETNGKFETVDKSQTSTTDATDPIFSDKSDITINLTPGSTVTGIARETAFPSRCGGL